MDNATLLHEVRTALQRQIAELEAEMSSNCVDAWPFVVVHVGETGYVSALKILSRDESNFTYNFSATGVAATRFSKGDAEKVKAMAESQGYRASIMPKTAFFRTSLAQMQAALDATERGITHAQA